jgi:hypothetical protein
VGPEPLILFVWVVQVIIATVIALKKVLLNRWFAAVGTALGLMIGFSPMYFFRGPAVWPPSAIIAVVSAVILVFIYGVSRRWKSFSVVSLLLAIPIVHRFSGLYLLSTKSIPSLLLPLGLVAELELLLGPILCALAGGEIFGSLDRLRANQRKPA